ncbi:MAG: DUF4832 domain-containing protein [Planctomycetia bacterium]|nr:DUF4832 domain-containing protein [Planctomycetia bacterium]
MNRKTWGLFFVLGLLLALPLQSAEIQKENGKWILLPKATSEPIVNPGKGWVAYGNAKGQPKEILDLCSLGYTRYQWSAIEPVEGEYRWEIIERDLKSWKDRGCQFAFGICGASSHSQYFWVSPKWIFDAGAKYDTFELINPKLATAGTPGKKLVPLFADPIYMQKLENFIKAFAKHFDGNPDIAFIDIRSYGNWGEGHMSPFRKHNITPEEYKKHIEIHRKAFKKTLLAIPGGNAPFKDLFPWCVENGITIRRDGICGNSNGSETAICEDRLPGIFEFYAGYPLMKKLGWWDGIKDEWKRGYKPADCVETGKPTWCDLSRGGKSGLILLQEDPELVRKLTNRIGYHHLIQKAIWPETIEAGKSFPVSVDWENRGVAYMFLPAKVSFALIANGKVVQTCSANRSDPRRWKPDTVQSEVNDLVFDQVPKGSYSLAVGLLQPKDGDHPSIKLGIDLPRTNGWYELGPITLR